MMAARRDVFDNPLTGWPQVLHNLDLCIPDVVCADAAVAAEAKDEACSRGSNTAVP